MVYWTNTVGSPVFDRVQTPTLMVLSDSQLSYSQLILPVEE